MSIENHKTESTFIELDPDLQEGQDSSQEATKRLLEVGKSSFANRLWYAMKEAKQAANPSYITKHFQALEHEQTLPPEGVKHRDLHPEFYTNLQQSYEDGFAGLERSELRTMPHLDSWNFLHVCDHIPKLQRDFLEGGGFGKEPMVLAHPHASLLHKLERNRDLGARIGFTGSVWNSLAKNSRGYGERHPRLVTIVGDPYTVPPVTVSDFFRYQRFLATKGARLISRDDLALLMQRLLLQPEGQEPTLKRMKHNVLFTETTNSLLPTTLACSLYQNMPSQIGFRLTEEPLWEWYTRTGLFLPSITVPWVFDA